MPFFNKFNPDATFLFILSSYICKKFDTDDFHQYYPDSRTPDS